MRMRSILPVFVAALVAVVFTTDAMAMYHPGLGRFVQRDPHGQELGPTPNRIGNTHPSSVNFNFIPRDEINPHLQYSSGSNIYQYVNSSPESRIDPVGLKDYEIGNGPRPTINWDNGFQYDPNATPTYGDRIKWRLFQSLTGAAIVRGHIPDGVRAYLHYRDGSGTDLGIDYNKAIGDDGGVETGLDNEIAGAQADIERLHDGVSRSFSVYSKSARLVNAETENWQKAIGGHRIWGSGAVTFDPISCEYSLMIFVDMEDFYNFNKGQFDIASGLPDNTNGRFEVFGWAKSFYSRGRVSRTVTWKKGNAPETTEVDGEPRRRRDRRRR